MALQALIARLDYLHFVCGMAWLFLGVLCRFGGWEKDHLLASRWLRWSFFALAIDQWIDGSGAVWAGQFTHEAAAYLASLLPLLGLLEFGRRVAAGSRMRALARWSLLLTLAFLAWLACRQHLGCRFLSLTVIAVPAAWVVIRTFTQEARQDGYALEQATKARKPPRFLPTLALP